MMNTSITHADIFRKWLEIKHIDDYPLWKNYTDKIIQNLSDFAFEKLSDRAEIFLEIPLLGQPKCDLEFSYDKDTFQTPKFKNMPGKRIEPLLWHLSKLLAQESLVGIEVDIDPEETKDSVPAIFFECTNNAENILNKLWVPSAQPPQWKKILEISKLLPSGWDLLYIGMMQGRKNAPIRMTFKRALRDGRMMSSTSNKSNLLLNKIGCKPLPDDAVEKLNALNKIGLKEWDVDIDVFPDGSFGNTIGIEVITLEESESPLEFLSSKKGQELSKLLKKWSIADDRLSELENFIGQYHFTVPWTDCEIFMRTFINHIKLRWDGKKILPAKVYLSHAYFVLDD